MKRILLTFILLIVLGASVGALETKIVQTDIRVDFNPTANCTESCTNSTVGNTTNVVCTQICKGILIVSGENLLKELILAENEIHDTLQNNVIRDFGNESDLTQLVDELQNWRVWEEKYNLCLDSNRNVSAKLMLYENDVKYEANFTTCDLELSRTLDSLNSKGATIGSLEDDLEQAESSKMMWGLVGIALGIVAIKFLLPKLKGEEVQRDDGSKEFPPNAPY